MASEHFDRLSELGLVVCRQCQYAVWPAQAPRHLRDFHRHLSAKDRNAITEDLQAWPNLHLEEDFTLPTALEHPLPGLKLLRDGKRCQIKPEACTYIAGNISTLKQHWGKAHNWSAAGSRGGSYSFSRREQIRQRLESGYQTVCYQRLFGHGRHSGYVEIRNPPRAVVRSVSPVSDSVRSSSFATAVLQDLAEREAVQQRSEEWIHNLPSVKEPSPWLQMTRWPEYLQGHHLPSVAALVAPPNEQEETLDTHTSNDLPWIV